MQNLFKVDGQTLIPIEIYPAVSDTVNYLTFAFMFSYDWAGLTKSAIFTRGTDVYEVVLTDDEVLESDHVNLSAGVWEISVVGDTVVDAVVTRQITTSSYNFNVTQASATSGGVFPPSIESQVYVNVNQSTPQTLAGGILKLAADRVIDQDNEIVDKKHVDDTVAAVTADDFNHNDLANKQGGTTNEYYHVTAAEKTIIENTSGMNTGDQNAAGVAITDAGGYYDATTVEGALQHVGSIVADGGITTEKMGFDTDLQMVVFSPTVPNPGSAATKFKGVLPKVDKSIDLYFSAGSLFLVKRKGNGVYKTYTFASDTVINIPNNSVLLWDISSNTLVCQGNTIVRNEKNLLLASNYYCAITNGALLGVYNQLINDIDGVFIMGAGQYDLNKNIVQENTPAGKLTIDLSTSALYAVSKQGVVVCSKAAGTLGTFVLSIDDLLIWDLITNTVSVSTNLAVKPMPHIVLTNCRADGSADQGLLIEKDTRRRTMSGLQDSIPQSSEGRTNIITNFTADQGMTVVGEEIWVYRAGVYDHSTYGNINVYNKDTFVKTRTMTHNFGHCATVDYNAKWDVLLSGNGESINTVYPRIDLLLNAKTYNANNVLNWNDNATTPRVSIEFFVKSGETITKQIGGSGCVACFGEEPYIVYMMTGQTVNNRIFKVLLGTGINDFSDASGTDLTKWGTYVTGKTVNEYNGTAKILQIFMGKNYMIYSQGLAFHDGKLFHGITTGKNTCEVVEVQLLENGTFKTVKTYKTQVLQNGNSPSVETEGTAILDGRYVIAGYKMGGTENLAIFQLYNEQGGKGVTETRITLPFPCNSSPNVKITPTNNVTDLYIASVDATGFTVLSASDGNGTFNWECKIS